MATNTVTPITGSTEFPVNDSNKYGLIETLASQKITGAKSANKLDDAVYEYEVVDGKVIEEAVIEMAEAQAYDKDAYDRAPKDPTLNARYFNNFENKQFQTTTRTAEIRKIIANKGTGVEQVVSEIIDTLTQGEGYYNFGKTRDLLLNAPVYNYRNSLGGVPKTMKGVIYAARDMYNALKGDNDTFTTAAEFVSSTPEEDIRIGITTKILNMIDVAELAHVFNLSKEELFGKLVVIPVDDLAEGREWYRLVVYDRKAMGRARRMYEYTQEQVAKGVFFNHYLTVEYAYFFNGLFKACAIDCSKAAAAAKGDLVDTPVTKTVTNTLTGATNSNSATSAVEYEAYTGTLSASSGYTWEGATVAITMGGEDITDDVYDEDTHVITIPNVTGNIVITATLLSE